MKKNKKQLILRQGDILLISVDSIPNNLVKTKKVVLALGEATGHHHSILDGNAIGYAKKETELCSFIEVQEALAALTHQEHDTIQLLKGKYQVINQVEYTPTEIRRVVD